MGEPKPEVRDYKAVRLSARFASRVVRLFEASAQRKALEEEEKTLRKEIAEDLADKGEKSVTCNGFRATYVSSNHSSISKQKLLDLKVPVSTIEKATTYTPFVTAQVTREKEKGEQ